ncbi:MgtC/SapB family protein [Mesorhizobium sp. BAC0120]|uniref:MgtC/SapB family protein n=1 Tax=Mesorhizobium sp. BAC0120 TaxID=3090670 RepID=UPI00298C0187|nr:MgtC/SapB family protein [Mesorhizobium sp. BAC0120]MDW6024798.1 MgtC/SapB family protein [Mesorhizobium sp. BAC0120]
MEELIPRLGLALAIGLLVGLERGWRERDAPDRSRTAGIRTYGISGLLGGIAAALANALGSASVLIAGFIGFAAVFASFKWREAEHDEDFSVTGVIAGLAVFALGALAVAGDHRAAAAAGAGLAGVLASREILHGLLRRLTWLELRSALILAVMTAIVLPLLPNRTIDPWGGLNPWEVWFFTVLTAAISFLGYVAVRVLGTTRGLVVSALAGAVISSTAVTLTLGRAAKTDGDAMPKAGAASLAAMVSITRVCVIAAIVQPQVLGTIGLTALAAALGFGLSGMLLLVRISDGPVVDQAARSPFELGPLLAFALLFGSVSTVNAALASHVGEGGLVTTSAISGALDVDVAVLSTLRLVGTSASAAAVGEAVLAAIAVNSLVRLAMAVAIAPARFWIPLLAATACATGFAVTAFLFLPRF